MQGAPLIGLGGDTLPVLYVFSSVPLVVHGVVGLLTSWPVNHAPRQRGEGEEANDERAGRRRSQPAAYEAAPSLPPSAAPLPARPTDGRTVRSWQLLQRNANRNALSRSSPS